MLKRTRNLAINLEKLLTVWSGLNGRQRYYILQFKSQKPEPGCRIPLPRQQAILSEQKHNALKPCLVCQWALPCCFRTVECCCSDSSFNGKSDIPKGRSRKKKKNERNTISTFPINHNLHLRLFRQISVKHSTLYYILLLYYPPQRKEKKPNPLSFHRFHLCCVVKDPERMADGKPPPWQNISGAHETIMHSDTLVSASFCHKFNK